MPLLFTILFLLLSLAFLSFVLRILHGAEYLLLAEKLSATITFYFFSLSFILFALGFAGSMRLPWIILGLAGLCSVLGLVQLRLPARHEELAVRQMLLEFLRALNPLALLCVLAALASSLFFLSIAVRMPVTDYDGLSYHLGLAVHMYQDGDFRYYPGESGYVNHFARGGEMLMALIIMLTRGLHMVNALQWFVLPPLVLSIFGAGRALGLNRSLATIAAAAPCAVPVILYQTTMAYVDLWSLGWFAIALCGILGAARQERLGPTRVLWVFAASGLSLAAKFNAVVPCIIIGFSALGLWGWRVIFVQQWRSLLPGLAMAASIGLPWMINNHVKFGSPLYPYALQIGPFTLADAPFPLRMVRNMAEAPPYYDMPMWEKAYLSWTTVDFESWGRIDPFSMSELPESELMSNDFGYRGDTMLGGHGLVWLLLGFPSLVVTLGSAWFVRWASGTPRRYIFALAAAPLAAYLLIVAGWWPRFALFLPVFGTLAFLLLVNEAWERKRWLSWALLALFLPLATFDWSTAVLFNRDRERIRRHARSEYAGERPVDYFLRIEPDKSDLKAYRRTLDEARPGETISFFTPNVPTFTGYFVDAKAAVRLFPLPAVWPFPNSFTNEQLIGYLKAERVALLLVGKTAPEEFRLAVADNGGLLMAEEGSFQLYEFPSHRAPEARRQ